MPSKYRIVQKYIDYNSGVFDGLSFGLRYVIESAISVYDCNTNESGEVFWEGVFNFETLEEAEKWIENCKNVQELKSKPPLIIKEYEF